MRLKKPDNPTVVRAGWLVDGTGGPIRKNVRMAIVDGRWAAIGRQDPGAAAEAGSLDLSACTLLPGLIDSHVHLCMSGTLDPQTRESQLAAGFAASRAAMGKRLCRHLCAGVVAVRDGGDGRNLAYRYKTLCMKGVTEPVDLKVAGRAWRCKGRYGRLIGRAPENGRSLAHAVDSDAAAVDHVKIVNSGLNSLTAFGRQTAAQFDQPELTQAVAAAGRRGRKVMVHANGRLPVRIAIAAGCHSVEHGFFMGRENLERMAERRIVWVPTACTMKAYADRMDRRQPERDVCLRTLDHQLDQMRMARGIGVPMALGTDAGSPGVHHGDSVTMEMRLMMDAGYPVQEAVQCATRIPAGLLDIETTGRIAVGRVATFMAVTGEPAGLPESLRQIALRCIRGRIVAPAAT